MKFDLTLYLKNGDKVYFNDMSLKKVSIMTNKMKQNNEVFSVFSNNEDVTYKF